MMSAESNGAGEVAEQGQFPPSTRLPLTPVDFRKALYDAAGRTPMLVPVVVAERGVSAISGSAGLGKSQIALDIALTLVFGLPSWHGHEIFNPRRRSVIYVDAENDATTTQLRALAWLKQNGRDDEESESHCESHLLLCHDPQVRLGEFDAKSGEGIAAEVKGLMEEAAKDEERAPVALVVLDTLARMSATEDANDAAKAEAVMKDAERIASECGVPVLVMAHPSKMGTAGIEAELRSGRTPGTQQLISGAQRQVDVLYSAAAMAEAGAGQENIRLLGQAKSRVSERDNNVYELEITGNDLELPKRTIEIEDGEPIKVDASIRAYPSIKRGEFNVRAAKDSKFGSLIEWLREHEHIGQDNAINMSEYKRKYAEDKQSVPVAPATVSKYLVNDEHEVARSESGLMSVDAPAEGKRGRPPKLFWVAGDDDDFA